TLVELGANGGVEEDRYYSQASKVLRVPSVRVYGRRLGPQEIDTALRSGTGAVAANEPRTGGGWLLAAIAAPALLGGLALGRRRAPGTQRVGRECRRLCGLVSRWHRPPGSARRHSLRSHRLAEPGALS